VTLDRAGRNQTIWVETMAKPSKELPNAQPLVPVRLPVWFISTIGGAAAVFEAPVSGGNDSSQL